MKVYLMYLFILIATILIIIISKDKSKTLNILGKITITTACITIFIFIVLTMIIKTNLNFVNISVITDYMLKEIIINNSLILIIGIIELIIGKYAFKKHYS